MNVYESAAAELKDKLGTKLLELQVFRGETTVVVDRRALIEACQILRQSPELAFSRLAAITAIDYWPQEPRFAVVYQLFSMRQNIHFGLQVRLPGDDAEVPTLEGVFANANWYEREAYDMFGIRFAGHSDPRRLLMPEDWEGHPLRKDYPLGYEEVQFTFNYDEIDRRKKYAQE